MMTVMRAGGLSPMPFRRSSSSNLAVFQAALRRLGAWVGVLALLLQLAAPLPQAQASDLTAGGLFAPTCSVHVDDQGQASLPSAQDCAQCPICMVSLGDRLSALPVSASVAAPVPVLASGLPLLSRQTLPPAAAHPPLPSRGPPAAA